MRVFANLVALAWIAACSSHAAAPTPTPEPVPMTPGPSASTAAPVSEPRGLDRFMQQVMLKRFTDLDFQSQLGREMHVRKVLYSGADAMIIPAYLFTPLDTTVSRPVMIIVHGGVHGDFDELYVPEVRSLVQRGYIVIAPEYRGSTGYGREHYDAIDYGGKEVEDVVAAREFVKLAPGADLNRLGIMGWSHGGFITLHSIFRYPQYFKVAVAHVPVADLPTRMRMHSPEYRAIFAAQKGFGGTFEQNATAYIQRSPIAHARELKTPLLVLTSDNDDDVFIEENHHLRDSMVVAGKDKAGLYTYHEWHNPPGKHEFSRVDTPQAREAWAETLAFLEKYLK